MWGRKIVLLICPLLLFLLSSTSSVISKSIERYYTGLVDGLSSGDEGIDVRMRIQWTNGRANIIMCLGTGYAGKDLLAKGVLDSSVRGTLKGRITQFDGKLLGSLVLRKRMKGTQTTWEGRFGGPFRKAITIIEGSPPAISPDNPLVVSDEFKHATPYIPQELFVYAYPKFERFHAARELLDSTFPHWRRRSTFCDQMDGTVTVDYEQTDVSNIGHIADTLRASGNFHFVELGIAEYGGMPEQVHFSQAKYRYENYSDLIVRFNRIAPILARDFFCLKNCTPVSMSMKSPNVLAFEIIGRSEDLHFKRERHWEKYVVVMTVYSSGIPGDGTQLGDFNIQFAVSSGFLAPSGNGQMPPNARFKEHPLDDSELSDLSSKLQQTIAKKMDAEYIEGF